jgi:hypothetical protein
MKKYMLFIREDLNELSSKSQGELQREIELMTKWVEELSKTENFVSGEPLEPEVRVAKQDEILHAGPFLETREGVSGYMIISAEDIDHASALAQTCPVLGAGVKCIEVRPILDYQND